MESAAHVIVAPIYSMALAKATSPWTDSEPHPRTVIVPPVMAVQAKQYKFKKLRGHCNVQTLGKKYSSLGIWVSRMSECYRDKKLSGERIELLEEIGFIWNKRLANWETSCTRK